MKKITAALSIVMLVFLCAGSYSYAGPINKWYYAKHPTTVEKLKNVYGEPINLQKQIGGTEKFVFGSIQNTMNMGHPFFIVKDGKVIDSGIQ